MLENIFFFTGEEYPAIVEYAPFQKVPKHSDNLTKDPRCGTIEEDPDYIAFIESLENPETITLPHLEQVVEEIEAKDRELRGNDKKDVSRNCFEKNWIFFVVFIKIL